MAATGFGGPCCGRLVVSRADQPVKEKSKPPRDKPMTDDHKAEMPAPKDLDASTALIVGGTAGIGLASAQALAGAGVPRIVIVGRNAERGQLAAKSIAELGAAAHFVAGDAADPTSAAKVAAEADQILSGIDILMCSTAADVRPELFIDIPTSDI